MLLDKKNDTYTVKLGVMGEQANPHQQIIYKPTWFYRHLPTLEHRLLRNDLFSEFNPAFQGRNQELLQRIREDNQCAIFRSLGTQHDEKTDQILIVGQVIPTGPHFSTFEQMLSTDPEGSTWEFRLRCLSDPTKEDGSKTLIPTVNKIITWDLYTY